MIQYRFTHKDVSRNFEIGLDESVDVKEYLEVVKKGGFKVECVTGESGMTAIEPKEWPETLPCVCGETMDFVSIEDGYSCRDRRCMNYLGDVR